MMLLLALLVPWAANAQETLTVHDGTATNGYVPFYGYYADAYNKCEMVYPATELSDMADGTITSMTFYATQSSVSWGCNFQVFLAEVDETTISAFVGPGTVVYEGVLSISGNQMAVTFSTPYVYNGGNLLVGVYNTSTGSYLTSTWNGETVEGASVQGYSYTSLDAVSPTQRNFLPKTTFGYLPAGAVYVASPSNLNVTLTPGDGTVATLAWTENGTATQWQICLNGDETNLIAATTNPWPLTGLTPETAYTAKVRATTADGESDWSNEVTFTPTDAYQLTVNDGTTTNGLVPIYGYWCDNTTKSQFIIPAENLADMAWGTISKMTFYASNASVSWGNAQFEVYMTETDETTLSELADYSTMTKVKNAGSLSISGNQMVVEFDAPYQYMGGNLMIGFLQTATGTYSSCSWYGVSAEGASMGGYGSSINQQNFLPKTTFDYIPGEEPACMWPTNLAVSNVTAHTAELSWTSDGNAWQIGYSNDNFATEQYVEVTENPYTLTGLDPETDYEVRVQTNCGGGTYSVFCTPVSFTTEVACPAPTDLVISDITAYSANVGWTSDNTNIELRYAPDIDPSTGFDNSQLHGWTNIDADGDGYEWVLASESAGVYHNDGVDVTETGHNSSYDYIISGSYSNAAGIALTPDNYLVSPQITLGGSISFWAQSQDASYCEEHFGVAVSTTGNTDAADFTTIAEWTITGEDKGMTRVLRSSNAIRGGNRATTEWVLYTVDLSAYSGQGYVALRHFDCTDMFILNVDDINIEQPGFEMPWVNVSNPTNPQALTNLEPETTYLVQVRANCGGEDGVSQWLEGTFTTLPACMVPTNLVISNIDKRSADLAWIANGEETQWQICLNGDETNLILVSDTSYSFTNLTPETLYNVKVRAVCDETLQSAWSTPAIFTTLVACPAPTALAISDITNVSAVATWTYDGDVELEYAEDVWKYYDNGTFGTSMGAGGTIYWGILLTPDMLPANQPLTHIAMYENDNNANPTTISIYSGGDTAPGTFLYSEEVTPVGNGFHEIALAEPVEFDATQNLWIVCYNDADTYPAAGSANLTNPNGRWVSLDGEEWADINGYGYNYTWMIRAAFGNNTTEWVAVNNPASPQTIAGLMPETNYMVRVRAVCGGEDGESVWVTTSFTTDVACPAPTALGATPYALSAELSWEGISESYTVRYGVAEVGEILSSFDFEDGTIPADFTNSTTYPWTVTEGGADGGYCVIPGNAGVNSTSSDLTLQVTGPCSVSFMAKVSSENNWDWGRFLIDGTQQMQISGTQDWTAYNYTVTEGTHTLVWRYYKDSSASSNDDLFYVDNIVINEMSYAWETTTATTNECVITGLEPTTTYYVQVMGDCGDFGTSEWSEMISFTTTEDACPVPTNLTVNNETLTATTADLSWNGSIDVESFTVRYRTPEHVVGGISESFDVAGVPAGWTRYSGLVDDVVAGTTTLTTTTSGWNTNSYALGTYNMKVNIYGTSIKYWLVSPEVTPTNGNFSFDLALTDYNNSDPIEDATAQADDRFVVLVYANDAWTILREWNNTGSDYVYNNIATTGEAVSIDLSAYVGQAVKIAFYGESTAAGGDNDMHIDNVVIGEVIPATDWMTVENITDMNVTLTGLTPETPYEAQVKADCSEAEEPWSNTVTFTTLEQTTLTQTIELAAGTNYVSFYVETTLADLKSALAGAAPTANISIKSQTQTTTYNPNNHRWTGNITLDLAQMYIITVSTDIEISLEGMPLDPAELSVTITGNGTTYIGFPFSTGMTLTDAFAGLAVQGDKIKSQNATCAFNRGRWGNQIPALEPGKGYKYISNDPNDRVLVYPINAKAE